MNPKFLREKNFSLFLPLFIVALSLFGCSSSKELTSTWQNHEIKIDGDPSEWKSDLQLVSDKKINLGFKNDDKFLYLCLTTDDRTKIFQLLRNGFIVWFEPESGDYKTYGVRYPLPNVLSDQQQMNGMNRENVQRENFDKLLQAFFQKQNELEIINKDKFPLTALPLQNREGIEAKLGTYRDMLVYELKVPLAIGGDYSFPAGAVPGDKITIRFETEAPDLGRARSESQEGMSSGERGQRPPTGGGMRGGGMRGGGMRARPNGGSMPEPLNYSVEVKLVAQPAKK